MAPPAGEKPDLHDRLAGEVIAMGCRGLLADKLPGILHSGEQVEFVALASPDGSVREELHNAGMLVLTDQRFMLISTKLLAATDLACEAAAPPTRQYDYRNIREVTERFGLLESKLDLHVGAADPIRLTSMRKKSARHAARIIRAHAPAADTVWRRPGTLGDPPPTP